MVVIWAASASRIASALEPGERGRCARATSALRQWDPPFPLDDATRAALVKTFSYNARGLTDTDFPHGQDVTRVMISGFDPFRLDGEPRHSNPSGVIALLLDGARILTDKGLIAIETVTLPVTWSGFDAGIVEDAFGPHLVKGGPERVRMIMTISQGRANNIEQWAGRWRGGNTDNNNEGIPLGEPIPEVSHWPMPPVQEFIETTLPHQEMLAADTQPYKVGLNPRICEWPVTDPILNTYAKTGVGLSCHDNGPTPVFRAESGGGGNYLSNESQYRSNRLRLGLGATDVRGGHLHTLPQIFYPDRALLIDDRFQQLRHQIADQAAALVRAGAEAIQ